MCANVSSYDHSIPTMHYFPPSLLPSPRLSDGISRKRSQEQSENGGGSSKRLAKSPEILFRLLIPATKIGKIIGKQGNQIKLLRGETGARIKIADPISNVEERVVLISSKDEAVSSRSAAEDALIRVATIVVEERVDGGPSATIGPQHHVAPNLTRLLIAGSQAGSLIGKAGAAIKDIRESSGANVRILPADQSPVCSSASDTDRLVQISGEISQIQRALQMIGAKLRENPPKEVPTIRAPYFLAAQQQLVLPQSGLSSYSNQALFRQQTRGVGGSSFGMMGGNPLGSAYGGSLSSLSKVTTEITIPNARMGGIIGRGGGNISQIRSMSGAAVKVSSQKEGTSERTISIEGTPDQVSTARSLVHAFLNAQ